MNILIINGSHRIGNTKRFVEAARDILTLKGHKVETIDLLTKRFEICDGCLVCEETGECVIDDSFTAEVSPSLKAADAYIFASPVYFNTVPTLFKNLIDRSNSLCGFFEENQKKLAVFLVGQADEDSLNSALNYIKEYAEIMNFDMSDENICVLAREADELDITENIRDQIGKWF